MKGDTIDSKFNLMNFQKFQHKEKKEDGSLKDKFPVIMDDGKTVIFISDPTKKQEVIKRYENRMNH